jgi:lipopolysaccharide transport system permease protein
LFLREEWFNFPKSSLVISSIGQAVVEFIVRIVLTVIVFLIYKVTPAWTAIFLPFAAVPVFLLTLGMGFFLSLLTGVFRDTVNIVTHGFFPLTSYRCFSGHS